MGFLNPQGDDLSRIDAMPGTTEVPPAGALEGLATAAPKGVAGAFAKMADLSNDFLDTDFGQKVSFALPIARAAHNLMTPDMRENANAATKAAAEWAATGSDPRKTGVAGRILTGTTEGLTIGLAGGAVAGPWGAAGLLGTTEGYATYKDAQAQGVDAETAKEQGILTGITAGVGAFLPLKYGKALATNILGGAGSNVTLGALQRGLTANVLEQHGYHDMASQYRIFDHEAMVADTILGGAFGVMGHYSPHTARAIDPADVDAAAAVATENHFNRSAPGIPTDPGTATLHADTMAGALHALADGDLPDIPADRAQQLVDNMVPDPSRDLADAPAAEPLPGAIGSDAGNGFKHGPDGYRYRVGSSDSAATGALTLEKRSEGGSPSTFYVGSDGTLLDADRVVLNDPSSKELVWSPPTEELAGKARRLLDEMGKLSLSDPARKVLKNKLRDLVTGKADGPDAPEPLRPPADSPLHEAAKAELPGFEAAAADIKPIEMPPEEVPPPKPEPQPAPAGEPAKVPDVPLDDFHGSMLDHLVHNYGDETYVTEDGREVTYRQMANEMQAQRNEADAFSKLHEVAAACALRNGV